MERGVDERKFDKAPWLIDEEVEYAEGFTHGFVILREDLELVERIAGAMGRLYGQGDNTWSVKLAEEADQIRDPEGTPLEVGEVRVVVHGEFPDVHKRVRGHYRALCDQRTYGERIGAPRESVNTILLNEVDRLGRTSR